MTIREKIMLWVIVLLSTILLNTWRKPKPGSKEWVYIDTTNVIVIDNYDHYKIHGIDDKRD